MLKNKLKEELVLALKMHDEMKRVVFGSLLAVVGSKEIEKRSATVKKDPSISFDELLKASELSDDEVVQLIQSEVKKRKEAIDFYEKGGREDLAKKENAELKILNAYLPEQLSEEDLTNIVKDTISELGIKDVKEMGKAINSVMQKVKGGAQGGEVSRIVREEISK